MREGEQQHKQLLGQFEDGRLMYAEEGPVTRVASMIMQIAVKEGCLPVRIRRCGRGTRVTWSDSRALRPLILPAFAAPRLAIRYMTMLSTQEEDSYEKDSLVIRGTIPIRYEELDYSVRAEFSADDDGIVIDLAVSREQTNSLPGCSAV